MRKWVIGTVSVQKSTRFWCRKSKRLKRQKCMRVIAVLASFFAETVHLFRNCDDSDGELEQLSLSAPEVEFRSPASMILDTLWQSLPCLKFTCLRIALSDRFSVNKSAISLFLLYSIFVIRYVLRLLRSEETLWRRILKRSLLFGDYYSIKIGFAAQRAISCEWLVAAHLVEWKPR